MARRSRSASLEPRTKKVALMPAVSRMSSTRGVTAGSGPLSKVSVTSIRKPTPRLFHSLPPLTGGWPENSTAFCARHEDQAFEQMHVLLVLEQRAVQRRDDGLAVLGAQ